MVSSVAHQSTHSRLRWFDGRRSVGSAWRTFLRSGREIPDSGTWSTSLPTRRPVPSVPTAASTDTPAGPLCTRSRSPRRTKRPWPRRGRGEVGMAMVAPCCVLLVSRWLTHLSGAELWRAGRSGLLLPTLLPSPSSPFKCPFNNPRWGADISPCSRSVQPQSTRRAQVGSGGVSVRYADGGAHTWLFAGHTPYDDWGLLCRTWVQTKKPW